MSENQPFASTEVRRATPEDMPEIYRLVRELAEYEKAPDAVTATLEMYHRDFQDNVFDALVITLDGMLIGTAIYYLTYSTWKGRMLYLEDFIITEKFRRRGYGKQLFDAFLDTARNMDVQLVKWQVLEWNTPAIRFYKKHYPSVMDGAWLNGLIDLK